MITIKKETNYMGLAGDRLQVTVDLSNVPDMQKFIAQLKDEIKKSTNGFKIYWKQTDLTRREKSYIIIDNNEKHYQTLKHVFYMNNLFDKDWKIRQY